jgi:N-acylneuraminate cytidylyltransferase
VVVPARGGSKGLPGKNIRPFAGLPLLVHSLRCAALVPRLHNVIVSTDSEEIAAVARAHGAEVPFLRPAALAQDDTPMMPVLTHALLEMERRLGTELGSVLLLDPTSPGRLPSDIERAFELLDADPSADGVIACSEPHFNPFWVGVIESGGYMNRAFDGDRAFTRRQDVPRFLRINGALYLWRRRFVLGAGETWWTRPHISLEIPEARAFSIDTRAEFDQAEVLVRHGVLSLPWLQTTKREEEA